MGAQRALLRQDGNRDPREPARRPSQGPPWLERGWPQAAAAAGSRPTACPRPAGHGSGAHPAPAAPPPPRRTYHPRGPPPPRGAPPQWQAPPPRRPQHTTYRPDGYPPEDSGRPPHRNESVAADAAGAPPRGATPRTPRKLTVTRVAAYRGRQLSQQAVNAFRRAAHADGAH